MPDLSVYDRLRSFSDYQRANEEFQMKKQLAASQMMQADAAVKRASLPDVDKIGEIAFMKAAMGQELTPQEQAAARYVDAKSGGIMFNPVTGSMMQKPRISERIAIPGEEPQNDPIIPSAQNTPPKANTVPIDDDLNRALQAAGNNPKARQEVIQNWSKSIIDKKDEQAKAGGFADRMLNSDAIIADTTNAGQSLKDKAVSQVPVFGNKMVSPEYQKFEQAQRDFVNAVLRRESGAVINEEEFDNARKQYFPQYGDTPETIKQKALNRKLAIEGIKSAAGRSYSPSPMIGGEVVLQDAENKPDYSNPNVRNEAILNLYDESPETQPATLGLKEKAEAIFNAKKAIQSGKDPQAVRQRLIDNRIDPKEAGL